MSDTTDVQEYIDRLNAERGRGDDADDGDDGDDSDERSHVERLRESILDGIDGD